MSVCYVSQTLNYFVSTILYLTAFDNSSGCSNTRILIFCCHQIFFHVLSPIWHAICFNWNFSFQDTLLNVSFNTVCHNFIGNRYQDFSNDPHKVLLMKTHFYTSLFHCVSDLYITMKIACITKYNIKYINKIAFKISI